MKSAQSKDNALSVKPLQEEARRQAQRVREQHARPESGQPDSSSITNEEEPEIVRLLAGLEVDSTEELVEPPKVLAIEANGQVGTIGTAGNFSVIIGAAKARKSFMTAAMVAAYINPQQPVLNCIQAHVTAQCPNVLYFDTEQARFHVLRAVKRICLLADVEKPKQLRTFALRSLDTKQRLAAIEHLIQHTADVGLVVIDGIRDVVFDINNAEEATDIATRLLRWTERYNLHLLTVLHTNKGNTEARGHLGTELINKAETVIRVSKDQQDKSISVVEPEQCRDQDFEPFAFAIDEQGLPYRIDDLPEGNKPAARTRKPKAEDLTKDVVEAILQRVFSTADKLRYRELQVGITEASEHFGNRLARDRAQELIIRVEKDNYLRKMKPSGDRYEVYQPNPDKLPINRTNQTEKYI